MSKKGTLGKFVTNLLIIMIFTAIIGFLALFTDGFTEDFKTFYVEYNVKKILSKADGIEITASEPLRFDVKYTFSTGSESEDYAVRVMPNVVIEKDFDFFVDGSTYSYQAENDLTQGFEIYKYENYFTLKAKGNITEILQAIYPQKTITDCTHKTYKDMFSLIITSSNGEQTIVINFSVIEKITGILLDKEVIIF